jgi:hypothetical protein
LRHLGSDNPRDLWKWLAGYEEKTGGNVLAIAHNGKMSNGLFPLIGSFTGKPIDKEDAEQQAWAADPVARMSAERTVSGSAIKHPTQRLAEGGTIN